jgi:hypothetical protein
MFTRIEENWLCSVISKVTGGSRGQGVPAFGNVFDSGNGIVSQKAAESPAAFSNPEMSLKSGFDSNAE